MKTISISILLFLTSSSITIFGQNFSQLKDIPLSSKEDCKKAQDKVIECSNYLLAKPCVEDLNSLNSIIFLIKWMGATPDYEFGTNDDLFKAIKSNEIFTGRYYAAIAKTAIEKNISNNSKVLEDESIRLFLEYCENPVNQVKISTKLQKIIDTKNTKK